MKNRASLRRELRATIAKLATAAAEKAVSGGDINESIKQLEAYQKLEAALPRSSFSEGYLAMVIAGICLLAASMAWTIRVPTTKIHLAVKTRAVSMSIAAQYSWEGKLHFGGIQLQEFSKLELPPELGTPQQLTGRAWLKIVGGNVKLTRLDIHPGTLISITRNESGDVDIRTLYQAFQGELDVADNPIISAGPAPGSTISVTKAVFDPPATVTFGNDGRLLSPARLLGKPLEELKLSRVPISPTSSAPALSLFSEITNVNQQQVFTSGIIRGAVTVSDTGEVLELKEGDPLHLDGVNGVISELQIGTDGFDLLFDGQTHGVALGAPGFERNLKPTLLEYLYHRQKLGFFWGAVTFLWGLIWSARRLLFA